jgi:hypothetical protein
VSGTKENKIKLRLYFCCELNGKWVAAILQHGSTTCTNRTFTVSTKCSCVYRNSHSERFTLTRGKKKGTEWKQVKDRERERERGKKGRNAIPVSSFYKRVCPDWVYSYVLWEKGLMNTGAFPVRAEVLFSSSLSCPRGRHNFRFITLHSCWSLCSLVINVLDSIRRWCFCFWLAISWGPWLTGRNVPLLSCWHLPNGDGRPCRFCFLPRRTVAVSIITCRSVHKFGTYV